jgi:hypothetical protein
MRLAFDVWWCGDAGWCGADDGTAAQTAMYCSWFKFYEYTPGQGDEGTDYRLSDWDNFEGQLTANWAEVYAVQLIDGKGVCCLNYNWGGGLGEGVPYDEGDTAANQPSEYWLPQPVQTINNTKSFLQGNSSLEYRDGTIQYRVENPGLITISLVDLNGRIIKSIENSQKNAGAYSTRLNTKSIPSGAYIIALSSPHGKHAKQLINISNN